MRDAAASSLSRSRHREQIGLPAPAGESAPSPATVLLRDTLSKLDELSTLETIALNHRSQNRRKLSSAKSKGGGQLAPQACEECRRRRSRCSGAGPAGGTDCSACSARGRPCVWPEAAVRGPKKRLTRTQHLLNSVRTDILRVLGDDTIDDDKASQASWSGDQQASRSTGPTSSSPCPASLQPQDGGLHAVLRNPLAVLAQQDLLLPPQRRLSQSALAGRYYEGGLYQELPEADLSLDPVSLGLMTHDDLARLVALYFHRMRPFYWHLDSLLHTPEFLRLNSPFLTTAVAATAATYDPPSHSIAEALQRHAEVLAARCFEVGCKSVEVVQAYGIMSSVGRMHWAAPGKSWGDDRSWAWQGQAMRLATEIRLDLPLQPDGVAHYQGVEPLTVQDFERFRVSRERTWRLLFAAEIAQGIQTGRMEALTGLNLAGGLRAEVPPCAEDDPDYNYLANESCNRIFARALNLWAGLRDAVENDADSDDSTLRTSFKCVWEPEIQSWQARWSAINPFIKLFSSNILVILNLISLRFPGGGTTDILDNCRAISIHSLQTISAWDLEDPAAPLLFASNFVLVNIAYSAVFLLKLADVFDAGPSPELEAQCSRVANLLERIGRFRFEGTSIATVHAERIRMLLAKSRPNEAETLEAADKPIGRQEVVVPSFGPGDAFQGLSGDVLSFTWPESFSSSAIDFLDAASWDPGFGFAE